jgi:NADH-quinone oxidoreductase subunit G
MPTIFVENKPYEVEAGQNLLNACLSLGFDIPYFCWHPVMQSVGACRMCAVKQFKDENDTKGKIVMSCMTPASDGVRISIDDPEAVKFRKAVSEWLMLHHPQDCPVCDEGGECHLQDMTEMTGQVYRRYRFRKRTHRNQYLGPFLNHDMNRCIQCYRCVRFYNDYAGGRDFGVFSWQNRVYFGGHTGGILKNEFAGNLVEVCPTGVFTDKTFAKHYTRKWDLQTAPSVCVHCGLGCNTIIGERYGMVRRVLNRFNRQVNGYFLCDRGRFGYEFINSSKRIRYPLIRKPDGRFETIAANDVVEKLVALTGKVKKVIGIGSARASLESNYALQRLVGPDRFFMGASDTQHGLITKIIDILRNGTVPSAGLYDIEQADAVLILGEDVLNTAPMTVPALRKSILRKPGAIAKQLHIEPWNDAAVREAIQQEKGPLYIAATHGTAIDDAATRTYYGASEDIARLGFAVAHSIDSNIPAVTNLNDNASGLVAEIAAELTAAERPLVISGTSCASQAVIEAAANVAYALHTINQNARIFFTVPECNSIGMGLLESRPISEALSEAEDNGIDSLIILENDVFRHIDAKSASQLLDAAIQVIAIDCISTRTTERAHYILPAATYAESDGTMVNNEGRAQRFFKVCPAKNDVREGWRWISDIMTAAGVSGIPRWSTIGEVMDELCRQYHFDSPVWPESCEAEFRVLGQKIPRQAHRNSGRTAADANIDVREKQPLQDNDSPLAFSMEGYPGQSPSALICRYWSPGWNSVQATNKYQREVGTILKDGDPGARLIEPGHDAKTHYFKDVPGFFNPEDDYFLLVPAYHVFGSEELSALAPGIAEIAVKPYIAINPDDVKRTHIGTDNTIEVVLSGVSHLLPVKIAPSVPRGLAVVPMGLAGMTWDGLPVLQKL